LPLLYPTAWLRDARMGLSHCATGNQKTAGDQGCGQCADPFHVFSPF
jgi:hypothetical protein